MDTRALSYFVSVCRHRSISRAAEEQFITRQAISGAVSKLEADLGTLLLIRRKTGIEITPAGQVLLEFAERILREWNDCTDQLSLLAASRRESIRISMCCWLIDLFTPDRFLAFEQHVKHTEIILSSNPPHKCLEDLTDGTCSFAVFCYKPNPAQYSSTLLRTERLSALCRRDLLADSQSSASLDAFSGLTMLACSHKEVLPKLFSPHFSSAPFTIRESPDNIDYTLGILRHSRSFLILPESLALRLADRELAAVPLLNVAPLSSYLIEKRGASHTPAEEAFRNYLIDTFAQL